uniref:Enhancer of polycomb-like protein n=1 Tax=Nicotiana sylvestris TaxID=4096 RepID=A0A1U7X2D1_NICSY|nr:PREDICTED: uncharacterized protein LOC104230000 isoform X3 [Nicotiana sylvestris]
MSRLSFRPRPLDIHKKLPILKSVKDFEDDDTTSNTRNHIIRLAAEAADVEVQQTSSKKLVPEIPIPEYVVVDTYERDYSRTFAQPTSYIHARGARAEIGEFVDYNLDNEDEDWLQDINRERKALAAEKLETILHKLEVLDHKARERAGVITPTLGSPILVLLSFDAAVEALQSLTIKYGVFQSVYTYWKDKLERSSKLVLKQILVCIQETSTKFLSTYSYISMIICGHCNHGNGGRSLFFGVCSLLHLLVIPIHIMYLGQGRRLTGFTQGGCKGGKTMCSHLKSFAR